MRCDDIRELMSESIDGRLDAERQKLLSAHLAECADCRREFDELKQAVSLVHKVEPVQPPSDLLQKIHSRIREPRSRVVEFPPAGREEDGRAAGKVRHFFSLPQTRVAIAAGIVLTICFYGWRESLKPEPESRPAGTETRELPAVPKKTVEQNKVEARLPPADAPAAHRRQSLKETAAVEPAAPVAEKQKSAQFGADSSSAESGGRIWQQPVAGARGGGNAMPGLSVGGPQAAAPAPAPLSARADMQAAAPRKEETEDIHLAGKMAAPGSPTEELRIADKRATDSIAPSGFARKSAVPAAREKDGSALQDRGDETATQTLTAPPKVQAPTDIIITTADPAAILRIVELSRSHGKGETKKAEAGAAKLETGAVKPAVVADKTIIDVRIPAALYPKFINDLKAAGEVSFAPPEKPEKAVVKGLSPAGLRAAAKPADAEAEILLKITILRRK